MFTGSTRLITQVNNKHETDKCQRSCDNRLKFNFCKALARDHRVETAKVQNKATIKVSEMM